MATYQNLKKKIAFKEQLIVWFFQIEIIERRMVSIAINQTNFKGGYRHEATPCRLNNSVNTNMLSYIL